MVPDVYRYNEYTGRWDAYDTSAPWLEKAATSYSLVTGIWSDINTGMAYGGLYGFGIRHTGHYAVLNHYSWPAGPRSYSQWSLSTQNAGYCTFSR